MSDKPTVGHVTPAPGWPTKEEVGKARQRYAKLLETGRVISDRELQSNPDLPPLSAEELAELRDRYDKWSGPHDNRSSKSVILRLLAQLDAAEQARREAEAERDRLRDRVLAKADAVLDRGLSETFARMQSAEAERDQLREQLAVAVGALKAAKAEAALHCGWAKDRAPWRDQYGILSDALAQLRGDAGDGG